MKQASSIGLPILAAGAATAAFAAAVTRSYWLIWTCAALAAAVAAITLLPRLRHQELVTASPPQDAEASTEPQTLLTPSSTDAATVVQVLYGNAGRSFRCVSAHMWLEDPASATFRMVAAAGQARPDGCPISAQGLFGDVSATREAGVERLRRVTYGQKESTVWRFAVPVRAGDAVGVAAVDIESDAEPDMDRLIWLSSRMTGSLSAALGLHVAQTETENARMLLDTVRELSRIIEPEAVIETTLDRAIRLAGAQTGSVMLVDSESGFMTVAASRGLPREAAEAARLAEGEGIAGWVLSNRQPVVVEDLGDRGPRSRRHGVRSAVCVPIADSDGVLGVLNVGNYQYKARFTQSHANALEALAGVCAVALRNARALDTAQEMYFDTLLALAMAMETKDPYSHGGTQRVAEIAAALGDTMGMTGDESQALRIAALLHDVGMSAAGESVTRTSRPLSTVERGMLKMHPSIAADVLRQAPALKEVVPAVYHHHERFDGSGYAFGLTGAQIPLAARVLAVADSYVAMTSDRAYRRAFSHERAMGEICAGAGSLYDPDVVAAFRELTESPGSSARHAE